jgi:hypothetical protein
VCATYWVSVTLLVTLFVGILPIVHSQGNWNLSIVHWAVLGVTGALLSVLLQLHNLDLPELGETEGKQLVHGITRSFAIGAIAAVLLYAAIWGEALDGQIFPELHPIHSHSPGIRQDQLLSHMDGELAERTSVQRDWDSLRNLGLSIFWAVLAGASPVVLRRLTRMAESSLGEPKGVGGSDE